MRSAFHSARPIRPKSSAPKRAISATRARCRAAATAALLPLPPGAVSNALACSVSPRAIGRATRETRSALKLATETTSAVTSLDSITELVRQPQDRLRKERHQCERDDQHADE